MKWTTFKKEFPAYGDNIRILVSDGKEVWVAYEDHNILWFVSETYDNEDDIRDRLTHWSFLRNVPLPKVK